MCYTLYMAAVLTLFFIGLILSVIHFFLGFSLAFIRTANGTKLSHIKWLVFMAISAVLSFLLFGYGIGTQLCLGHNDFSSCVESVMDVTMKIGLVIFPVIIGVGMFGIWLGDVLAKKLKAGKLKSKQIGRKTKKKKK